MVGLGFYMRSNVHVDDGASLFPFACNLVDDSLVSEVSNLYMVLYDAILNRRDGLYVGENSKCLEERFSEQVGEALVKLACAAPMNGHHCLTRGIIQDLGMDMCIWTPGVNVLVSDCWTCLLYIA